MALTSLFAQSRTQKYDGDPGLRGNMGGVQGLHKPADLRNQAAALFAPISVDKPTCSFEGGIQHRPLF